MLPWNWIALGALAILVAGQQFHMYRIRRDAKKRDELFRIVTENAADMIALVDVKGHRLYNSPAYKRILGYSAAELGETSAFEQIHPDDRFKVLEAARQARTTGVGQKIEYRIRHKNGTWRVLESAAGTIRDGKGEVTKLVIVNRDVTERKKAEEQAEYNAFHDGLTGLPNRRLFLERLQNFFDRARRSPERQYALLFVDLDGFKAFNDAAGTKAGDQLLVEMGRRLAACLRDEDLVSRGQDAAGARNTILSRMGGDEFAILLEGVNEPSDAMRVGDRIRAAISAPFSADGCEHCASASIGLALNTPAHERAEELLHEADVAMRRAKALGGSRCELFDEAMHARAVNRLKLESELRHALEKKQFRLHYQPIVKLGTNTIAGFEALLRWQHPEQGLISPYKFLAIAEDLGLLVAIGQWQFRQVCTQLRAWESDFPAIRSIRVSLNISPRQLADPGFVKSVEAAAAATGGEKSSLRVEISEQVAAADPQLTANVLSQLKRAGVGVMLDDLGTGKLSLIGLRHLPVEALKIDRSLVSAMLADRDACDTVELIILMGRKLNLEVIAEGIENGKQRDRLRNLGCELGQGFLYSQPVDAHAASQLLRQSSLAAADQPARAHASP